MVFRQIYLKAKRERMMRAVGGREREEEREQRREEEGDMEI